MAELNHNLNVTGKKVEVRKKDYSKFESDIYMVQGTH